MSRLTASKARRLAEPNPGFQLRRIEDEIRNAATAGDDAIVVAASRAGEWDSSVLEALKENGFRVSPEIQTGQGELVVEIRWAGCSDLY